MNSNSGPSSAATMLLAPVEAGVGSRGDDDLAREIPLPARIEREPRRDEHHGKRSGNPAPIHCGRQRASARPRAAASIAASPSSTGSGSSCRSAPPTTRIDRRAAPRFERRSSRATRPASCERSVSGSSVTPECAPAQRRAAAARAQCRSVGRSSWDRARRQPARGGRPPSGSPA